MLLPAQPIAMLPPWTRLRRRESVFVCTVARPRQSNKPILPAPAGIADSCCDEVRSALQLSALCNVRSFRQAARPGGRSEYHETLRRSRAVPEGVAGNQRQRVFGCGRERSYLFGSDDADVIYSVGALAKFVLPSIKPLNLNFVACLQGLKRSKPACAMPGQFHIAGFAQTGSAKEPSGTKCQ